jgi:hypothetical protein
MNGLPVPCFSRNAVASSGFFTFLVYTAATQPFCTGSGCNACPETDGPDLFNLMLFL